MMSHAGPLLLVGCGKMGGALLAGWLEGGLSPDKVTILEQGDAAAWAAGRGCRVLREASEIDKDFRPEIVLLAVKPQQMDKVLPAVKPFTGPASLVISVAAGRAMAGFEAALGAEVPIVRVMPNTPAAVGRGISVLFANPKVDAEQRKAVEILMSAVGEVAWIEEESLMDPVTALSGGGPAYVFLLIETMARAGVAAGLPQDLAERLARVTVAGAGELVHRSEESPATLRENVTSPGGTTLEALKVLMAEDGLQPLFDRAIAAASRRSAELAS